MIITVIKCLPARRGKLRTWAVTQRVGRTSRTIEIIARTGCDALAVFQQAIDLKRRVRDLEAA